MASQQRTANARCKEKAPSGACCCLCQTANTRCEAVTVASTLQPPSTHSPPAGCVLQRASTPARLHGATRRERTSTHSPKTTHFHPQPTCRMFCTLRMTSACFRTSTFCLACSGDKHRAQQGFRHKRRAQQGFAQQGFHHKRRAQQGFAQQGLHHKRRAQQGCAQQGFHHKRRAQQGLQ